MNIYDIFAHKLPNHPSSSLGGDRLAGLIVLYEVRAGANPSSPAQPSPYVNRRLPSSHWSETNSVRMSHGLLTRASNSWGAAIHKVNEFPCKKTKRKKWMSCKWITALTLRSWDWLQTNDFMWNLSIIGLKRFGWISLQMEFQGENSFQR